MLEDSVENREFLTKTGKKILIDCLQICSHAREEEEVQRAVIMAGQISLPRLCGLLWLLLWVMDVVSSQCLCFRSRQKSILFSIQQYWRGKASRFASNKRISFFLEVSQDPGNNRGDKHSSKEKTKWGLRARSNLQLGHSECYKISESIYKPQMTNAQYCLLANFPWERKSWEMLKAKSFQCFLF